jgi:hypothetical protein
MLHIAARWTCSRFCLRLAIAVLLAPALLAGCSRKEADQPPVATPTLTMARDRVAIGSPVNLTYRFQVASDAKFDSDYWVFVHFLDPSGEQLCWRKETGSCWTDDHQPPTPTSQWKPGETVQYTRTIFVPNYPYIGEAIVRVGLYNQKTGRRLALSGTEISRREYVVAKFQMLPSSANVFLIPKDGWHPPELSADDPSSEWQWTQKTATISFRNPKKDANFYVEYDARTDLFNPPQQVTIRLAPDQVVGSFTADSKTKKLHVIPITAAQFGNGEMAEVKLDVDRTFQPGGADTRELGIRVFHTFIEPK